MKDLYWIIEDASIMQCYQLHVSNLRNSCENSLIIYTTTQFSGKWINSYCLISGEPLMN